MQLPVVTVITSENSGAMIKVDKEQIDSKLTMFFLSTADIDYSHPDLALLLGLHLCSLVATDPSHIIRAKPGQLMQKGVENNLPEKLPSPARCDSVHVSNAYKISLETVECPRTAR